MSNNIINYNQETINSVTKDATGFVLKKIYDNSKNDILCILSDGVTLKQTLEVLKVLLPNVEILTLPAWDSVPYDRVSPNSNILSTRIDTLAKITLDKDKKNKKIILTSIGAAIQKLPPQKIFYNTRKSLTIGAKLKFEEFLHYVAINGYVKVEQVIETGEYAIRGDIIDIYPSGAENPIRIDLFDNEIERLRTFDITNQRTIHDITFFNFESANEVILNNNTIKSFRTKYRELFGSAGTKDEIYESISAGKKHLGMENWLPLFYDDSLPTIFDYLPLATAVIGIDTIDAMSSKLETINDHYIARLEDLKNTNNHYEIDKYRAIEPNLLYLDKDNFFKKLTKRESIELTYLSTPLNTNTISFNSIAQHSFSTLKNINNKSIYENLKSDLNANKHKIKIICCYTEGSLNRMYNTLKENEFKNLVIANNWNDITKEANNKTFLLQLELSHGFINDEYFIATEQDIWGERKNIRATTKVSSKNLIADISTLNNGEFVVHIEHGIGRFEGLENIISQGIAHDCLKLTYAKGDKLYVPVENINVISRYGAEDSNVTLDTLGGGAWESKKAKVKEKIKDIADKLIKLAAIRHSKQTDVFIPQQEEFDEFCNRFLYTETDDQLNAVNDVIQDLSLGRPMDRLVCGDVGFGKTEIALRAAFVVASQGAQVAIIAPTTLLARQHYLNFTERFKGFPIKVKMLSRLIGVKESKEIKEDLKNGSLEIIIGTHALLAKNIEFCNLGLLIIDEEQHFGVSHKEKLKALKENVHILTLSATPIPRTLQLSLTGVKQLSIIATPPVDRLAARTFVTPYDPVIIREAIYREKYRGGQIFFVCPRVSDIVQILPKLQSLVPDIRIAVAHGQMPPSQLEDVMCDFADGKADILLSTTIIESGIDLPKVNTMIIHRSDLFGLAQLYQLRGRIGRSKLRGYCYFTIYNTKSLTDVAKKRLNILESLNQLGAGFSLANYDLDMRGAGNIIGIEQSGHIKDVGIALYHHLLEEEINRLKNGYSEEKIAENNWNVFITTGVPIIIPETYIADLGVRLGLYKRIGDLVTIEEINDIKEELIDRFGSFPDEVENLLNTIELKQICKLANICRVDAGAKGILITFYNNKFNNPDKLIDYITKSFGVIKIKPDQKIFINLELNNYKTRLDTIKKYVSKLYELSI